jgi:EmrB/QacA subfamily drug resistance transporter
MALTLPKPSPIALICALAMFMEMLDGSILVTALPQMARAFHTTPTELSLGVTAYILVVACCVPLSGWMADRFGSRTVFCFAVAGFVLASILCATSVSEGGFVFARVLQGAAAGMMSPVGRLMVVRATEKKNLVAGMAVMVWPALIAPVIGPPLGGLITDLVGWRWIFLLNLPIGIAGLFFALRLLPQQKSERRPFDFLGFVATAAALASLLGGLDRIGAGRSAAPAIVLVGLGLGLGAWAIRHMHRADHPVIDLGALRTPTFAAAVLGGMPARVAISASPFLIPLLYQEAFGMTAFSAGGFLLAYMLGNLTMKSVTTPILRRFGFRRVLLVNSVISACSIMALALIAPGVPLALSAAMLFASGASRSMEFTAITTLTFADVPPERRTGANVLAIMLNQLGLSLGVALGAMLLSLGRASRHGFDLALQDFRLAFLVAGVIGLASFWSFRRLASDAAAEVSGHRPRSAAVASDR